jgi:Pentapeptide repeats (8 copies)
MSPNVDTVGVAFACMGSGWWDHGRVPPRQPTRATLNHTAHEDLPDQSLQGSRQAGWMRLPLWLWPPIAIGLIAFAGQLFGTFAALLTATETVGAALYAAIACVKEPARRAIAGALSITLCTVLIVAGIAFIRTARHVGTQQPTAPAIPKQVVDFRGRTIKSAMLANLDFRGADLRGARLDKLDLRGKTFDGADAPGASFRGSQLEGVSMRGINLSGAQMQGSCLRHVDFSGADLNSVDVKGAEIEDDIGIPPAIARKWADVAGTLAKACDI